MDLFASIRRRPPVVVCQVFLICVMLSLLVLAAVVSADAAVFANDILNALALLENEVDPATHLSGVDYHLALPLH